MQRAAPAAAKYPARAVSGVCRRLGTFAVWYLRRQGMCGLSLACGWWNRAALSYHSWEWAIVAGWKPGCIWLPDLMLDTGVTSGDKIKKTAARARFLTALFVWNYGFYTNPRIFTGFLYANGI